MTATMRAVAWSSEDANDAPHYAGCRRRILTI
jgi:hypothetical protein